MQRFLPHSVLELSEEYPSEENEGVSEPKMERV